MVRFWVAIVAVLWAGAAVAADQPRYEPPPAWVQPVEIPRTDATPSGAALQLLLWDSQVRFGDADQFYMETAFRIITPAGLAVVNGVSPSWNPETETLTFHRFDVLRAGRTIDLLQGGKLVTVLRREKNLELAMLDGDLTATLQPEGLQVGDIIDVAYTLSRKDPVLRGNSEAMTALPGAGVTGRVFLRALWPDGKAIRWRVTEGMPKPVLTHASGWTELAVDAKDFTAPSPPTASPARYHDIAELETTQFADWAAVSALMAPLYEKAQTLGAGSPLRAEAATIRATFASPKARAEAALRLVQDKVRYAFIGLNLGSYLPADADVTWSRRFGDCKGKTALLIALLRELGVKAEPALVTTTLGDGLEQRLPELVFDHVVARAEIGGKVYWLDATRSGDRNLDDIEPLGFHWALPVRAAGAGLERLTQPPLEKPSLESMIQLDASAGVDAPSPARAEHLFRGDQAVGWNALLTSLGRDEAQRSLRAYWRDAYSWIDIKDVDFAYDDLHRTMRITMDGSAQMHWANDGGARDFDIDGSALGYEASFKRDPGLNADAPFAVAFPTFEQRTVTIKLPANGSGFGLLQAGAIDRTIAGVRYRREARIEAGVVTMTASEQSLAPEFPASEAAAAAADLRTLGDFDVTVRNSVQLTETVDAGAGEVLAQPTDAAGYANRAAAYLHAHDYARAIGDLDQAIKLDPTSAKYAYNRGVAHFENHQDDLAVADFDLAVRLNPSDVLPLEARAQIELFRGDADAARKDFDDAERLSGGAPAMLLREAHAYDNAGLYRAEAALFSRMIAKAPSADLFNARCWTRAEEGRDLDAALADCDAALKLAPSLPAAFDSRALVELRQGRLEAAIHDYDATLAKGAARAASLYGRGLAELRSNARQAADADMAAARALDPNVDHAFARMGLTP